MTLVARMFSNVKLNLSPIKSLTVCTQMTSTSLIKLQYTSSSVLCTNNHLFVTHNLDQANPSHARQMFHSVRPYETHEGTRDHLRRE